MNIVAVAAGEMFVTARVQLVKIAIAVTETREPGSGFIPREILDVASEAARVGPGAERRMGVFSELINQKIAMSPGVRLVTAGAPALPNRAVVDRPIFEQLGHVG